MSSINNLTDKTQTSGVLTFAFGSEYQTQALCQALTLRKSLGMELTAVVGEHDTVDKRLEKVANIKALKGTFSRFEYEQHALDLTPYDITFKTDADLLFPVSTLRKYELSLLHSFFDHCFQVFDIPYF